MSGNVANSPTLAQHLLDVVEVLDIFRRRNLFGAVHPRVGDANVVHGAATVTLHRPGQLQCRASSAVASASAGAAAGGGAGGFAETVRPIVAQGLFRWKCIY